MAYPFGVLGIPYSSLSATQWVSFYQLQNAVAQGLLPWTGTTIPNSDGWANKTNVVTYVNINTANATYAPKTASQWVAKQDLTSNVTTANYLYLVSNPSGTAGTPTGFSSAANACAVNTGTAPNWFVYYSGTLANGTIFYSTPTGGSFSGTAGIPPAFDLSTFGSFFYVWQTSGATNINQSCVLTNNGNNTYTVSSLTTCTITMPFKVKNNNASTKTTFTAQINSINVSGMTGISLTGGGVTSSGTTTAAVVGTNTVVLTGGASTKTIAGSGAIVDAVTSGAVTYSVTSGNGTTNLTLSVTLTSGNQTNGIIITIT